VTIFGINVVEKAGNQNILYFAQNGDKVPKFVVFWTISTIQDENSAAKFRYIKTLSGKVVAQSIAYRVVSIYWQGVAPFP